MILQQVNVPSEKVHTAILYERNAATSRFYVPLRFIFTHASRPIQVIACSPMDAGQTDVMTDRHDISRF